MPLISGDEIEFIFHFILLIKAHCLFKLVATPGGSMLKGFDQKTNGSWIDDHAKYIVFDQ